MAQFLNGEQLANIIGIDEADNVRIGTSNDAVTLDTPFANRERAEQLAQDIQAQIWRAGFATKVGTSIATVGNERTLSVVINVVGTANFGV